MCTAATRSSDLSPARHGHRPRLTFSTPWPGTAAKSSGRRGSACHDAFPPRVLPFAVSPILLESPAQAPEYIAAGLAPRISFRENPQSLPHQVRRLADRHDLSIGKPHAPPARTRGSRLHRLLG